MTRARIPIDPFEWGLGCPATSSTFLASPFDSGAGQVGVRAHSHHDGEGMCIETWPVSSGLGSSKDVLPLTREYDSGSESSTLVELRPWELDLKSSTYERGYSHVGGVDGSWCWYSLDGVEGAICGES